MGDGVSHAQAQAELAQLAEVLGAGVFGAMASEINIPWTHPLYRGLTGHMFGSGSRRTVETADAVVVVGTYVFPDVFPSLESPFRADAKVIHIDLSSYDIAKNYPITLGFLSDPKPTMALLAQQLVATMSEAQRKAARSRAERMAAEKESARAAQLQADAANREAVPLYMSAFAEELAKHVPGDAIIVDEAITNSAALTRYLPPSIPGHLFQTPGGTLGIGFPGAVGAKLAHPDRTVVGFSGDGGAVFTFPALWSAAHYRVGAKFIVTNNRSYRILKDNLVVYWRERGINSAEFPAPFDIHDPDIDYVSLAKGMGVPGLRVSRPGEMAAAIKAMLEHDGPFLIDLILEDTVRR
jgi:benzoylformate decarboxylase